MPWCTVNGVTIPGRADTASESVEAVGDIGARGVNGDYFETRVARKTTWRTKTVLNLATTGLMLRGLIEADGHHAPFTSGLGVYTSSGIAPASGGSYTFSGSGGKTDGKVNVSSTSFLRYALGTRMHAHGTWQPAVDGFTLMVWKKLSAPDGGDGTTYFHHIATGVQSYTRGAAANPVSVTQYRNGVAGSWSMGNWTEVSSSGNVSIHGYTNAGAGAAYDYDELVVLPFAVDASTAAALYTFLNAASWPAAGKVTLAGDIVPKPVTVVGRVPDLAQRNVRRAGVHHNNARELDVLFVEV